MKLTYEELEKSRNSWKNFAEAATMYLKVIYGGDADRKLLISEIAKLSEWNAKHIEENDKLKLKIAELEQDLTGRTMSCVFCNNSAKERDEAIRERDEVRAMMVKLCHMVADDAISEQAQDKTVALPDPHWRTSPPYDLRKVTQQDVERLMNNPIIKDIKFKDVKDDTN